MPFGAPGLFLYSFIYLVVDLPKPHLEDDVHPTLGSPQNLMLHLGTLFLIQVVAPALRGEWAETPCSPRGGMGPMLCPAFWGGPLGLQGLVGGEVSEEGR